MDTEFEFVVSRTIGSKNKPIYYIEKTEKKDISHFQRNMGFVFRTRELAEERAISLAKKYNMAYDPNFSYWYTHAKTK